MKEIKCIAKSLYLEHAITFAKLNEVIDQVCSTVSNCEDCPLNSENIFSFVIKYWNIKLEGDKKDEK